METKDLISMAISLLAFLLSLIATITSSVGNRNEKQRAIKNEITNTLAKIVANNLDGAKLYRESTGKEPGYVQMVSTILSQQNAFLLHQAAYLAEQVPALVTAIEYNTMATAAVTAGDLIAAEQYHLKAVKVAKNAYYRALAVRGYAVYLFSVRRFEAGRDQFERSIRLLAQHDSHTRYTNGFTYQVWGWNERHVAASPARADELFESAAREFQGIDDESARTRALTELATVRGGPTWQGSATVGDP